MKPRPSRALEQFRVKTGDYASRTGDWHGAYQLENLFIIAGDGMGWEHVSVSRRERAPSWNEMCQVKSWFWGTEEAVFQIHPPKSSYVNHHPYCLHLWKPIGVEIALPDPIMVGPRSSA